MISYGLQTIDSSFIVNNKTFYMFTDRDLFNDDTNQEIYESSFISMTKYRLWFMVSIYRNSSYIYK